MASQQLVKQYIAYWFQLGKSVLIRNGAEAVRPEIVLEGERYSRQFEDCWEIILSPQSGDCYLEGTNETIAELLTPRWDIESCARCLMPVPLPNRGMPALCCPCFDLPNWPDSEKPQPRGPINSRLRLLGICQRLIESEESSN